MNPTGDPDPTRIELKPGVELWATSLSALAHSRMSGKITALVDVYEYASSTYLAVDLIGTECGDMNVMIFTGHHCTDYSPNDLVKTCFDTVDIAHARRMANELLRALASAHELLNRRY